MCIFKVHNVSQWPNLRQKGGVIALYRNYPITKLWSITCCMGSHSVTCHPTQVNVPHLNASQPVLDLPTLEGWKAELT